MKKLYLVLTLVVLVASVGSAQIGLRNISSLSADLYFNDEAAAIDNDGSLEKLTIDLNQVILFRVTDWMSAEIKLQRQDEQPVASAAPQGWHETTISIAPIFVVSQYNYIITRYGLGIGTGYERPAGDLLDVSNLQGLSHDLTIDANYETPTVFANLTLRGSLYPDLDYWFVVPSAGAKYSFPFGFSLSAKYFFSFNSQAAISHAFLSEVEFPVSDRVSFKVGGSGAATPTRPIESRWSYTAIAGTAFRITEALGIKYHVEYLGRQNAGPGIRNLFVLDARF